MISKRAFTSLRCVSIAFFALSAAGCSSSSSGSPAGDQTTDSGGTPSTCSGTPATHTVTVGANGMTAFSPADLTICSGDTVQWTWMGSGHTVTSGTNGTADGKFCNQMNTDCATAPLESSGNTYSFTFTTAGAFPYFCRPHAALGMTGTITVQ